MIKVMIILCIVKCLLSWYRHHYNVMIRHLNLCGYTMIHVYNDTNNDKSLNCYEVS